MLFEKIIEQPEVLQLLSCCFQQLILMGANQKLFYVKKTKKKRYFRICLQTFGYKIDFLG